jgi:hypothetical protein
MEVLALKVFAAEGANNEEGIERVRDEPRREDNGRDGRILPTVRARCRLRQPAPETAAAKHLAAAWFDDRVEERLVADAAHELVVHRL